MKLGLMLGYSAAELKLPVELVQRAEALGFDSVWTAEAYGSDATSPLAYLAAVTRRIRPGAPGRESRRRAHLDDEPPREEERPYCHQLAKIAPLASRQTKRLVTRAGLPDDLEAHLREELNLAANAFGARMDGKQ